MILLSDIFRQLEHGELNQFSMSGEIDGSEGIQPGDWPILIDHINLALTNMHTRLALSEREVTIQLYEELSFYRLDSKYAQSNGSSVEDPKYIVDTVERPFQDNVLRIERVTDELGTELAINDETSEGSVYLVDYKTLQVSTPSDEITYFIAFRANHPTLDRCTATPQDIEVCIPEYCLEPLMFYVASRLYGRSGSEVQKANSLELMQRYEFAILELERRSVLSNLPNKINHKLGDRGWV